MERRQIAELLDSIQSSYPGKFVVQEPTRLLDSWELVLQKHDYERVMRNFDCHLESSVFPPTIADLVKKRPLDRMDSIPSVDETLEYLRLIESKSEISEEAAHSIEVSKAQIRKILGRS
ncbi:replicative helicase loader/inhibitor [Peribacillus frigoritolerans]|uniref:replicative helicase loader/inhibitor n=1 Tax=Peribacillus frigoritolerans TaxID=450367 RepID=UPI002E2339FA|nr:replicative helicase loader/inhibitor [Peribacillus frigoritolerans]